MSQSDARQDFSICTDADSDNGKTDASVLAEKFAEDHYDDVFRYCARRLPSKEDAQDATQEVFLRLVKSHALYERGGKPLAYLYTCARNVCSDFYRRAAPLDSRTDVEWDEIPDASARDEAERISLADAIARLPEQERDVLELRYGQDLSVTDIARIQGMSRFSVYRSCKRALGSLKQALGGR